MSIQKGLCLHVPETQRPGGSEGDKPHEVREHRESNTLGSDCGWKDLSAPNEAGCINKLEKHNEPEDENDTGNVASLVRGREEASLQEGLGQEIARNDWKSDD